MTAEGPGPASLQIAALSDVGRTRQVNQDYAYAGPVPGAEAWELLAVADGLGGHASGEWASQRTIELLAASLAALLEQSDPPAAFETAVTAANTTVHGEALKRGISGSSTTLVAALCRDDQAWWVNIGDSRLYLYSSGNLSQVSADHSWVGEQVRAGFLTPEAARHHPRRNVVTRTIGFEPDVLPETGGPISLAPGEALVLCSDGLHGPVEEREIARAVGTLDPARAAERLVQLANEAGGPDNITVVIARLGPPPEDIAATRITPVSDQTAITQVGLTPSAPEPAAPPRRGRPRWLIPAASALILAAATIAVALAFR